MSPTIHIHLKNCHGIREMTQDFKFSSASDGSSPTANIIYAPNGTMKTSFAETFNDLQHGFDSKDEIFPDRVTTRNITTDNGSNLSPSEVVVVQSYDEEYKADQAVSTLLINKKLRQEYERIEQRLDKAIDSLIQALQSQAQCGTKINIADCLSKCFTGASGNFQKALSDLQKEIDAMEDSPLDGIPYPLLFSDKVRTLFKDVSFRNLLKEYIEELNGLLDESTFFQRDAFNYYNAENTVKALKQGHFFEVKHQLLLHGKDTDGEDKDLTIDSADQLEDIINEEKKKLFNDQKLKRKFQNIEKALEKNIDTREFSRYISNHTELLAQLEHYEQFEQSVWKSYLYANRQQYDAVISAMQATSAKKQEIQSRAAKEHTQWENVIAQFNQRFFVPFELKVKNREAMVLGQEELPELGFDFKEGANNSVTKKEVNKETLLRALSNGEKRAFYILNILFEVEARKQDGQKTLFIVDDIAETFDYRNKYAIVQYLKEMVDYRNFQLIILTHNFDFFRTLVNKGVGSYDHSFYARKTDAGVVLSRAKNIKGPFSSNFKKQLNDNELVRIASIPIMRNLIEYTQGPKADDYKLLTSLLHMKSDTGDIVQQQLDKIYANLSVASDSGPIKYKQPEQTVLNSIFETANKILDSTSDSTLSLDDKVALSIAIRLRSEQYMIAAIDDSDFVDNISSNQTSQLYREFIKRNLGDDRIRDILNRAQMLTPDIIHVNAFMYEPIIDMSDIHLRKVYRQLCDLSNKSDSR